LFRKSGLTRVPYRGKCHLLYFGIDEAESPNFSIFKKRAISYAEWQ